MSVVVFCGPTLGGDDFAPYPQFEVRPPVRQGELYAAAQAKPAAIGVVDGYFDGVPAVWHKEVLWAIQAGIAVFGASSMGALRASELHPFGMRGIGRIFEDYRDGRLTDDDEVALLHGPAEAHYVRLSEPMVNVRATLDRAVAERVIPARAAMAIAAIAKARFYQERTWKLVLNDSADKVSGASLDRLAAWLPTGMVDQKREDGLALLRAVDGFVRSGERQAAVTFSFEWTETWANAPWLHTPRAFDVDTGDGAAILDELRLDGDAYVSVRRAALLQVLAVEESARLGIIPDRREVAEATMRMRSPRGLTRQSDVERWAVENGIDAPRLRQLLTDAAGLEKLARMRDPELQGVMLDQLRLADQYTKLRRRTRAKARALAKLGPQKVPPPTLLAWYFEKHLKQAIPDDLAAYASGIGLRGRSDFYRLIAAEYALGTGRVRRGGPGRSRK